jgi:hypothetical protein
MDRFDLEDMTFEEFVQNVDHKFHNSSYRGQLRYGQYIMNELYNIWPEKYAQITGSDIDCFYDNSIVRLTLDALEKDWQING